MNIYYIFFKTLMISTSLFLVKIIDLQSVLKFNIGKHEKSSISLVNS